MTHLKTSSTIESASVVLSPDSIDNKAFFNVLNQSIDELPYDGNDLFSPVPIIVKEHSLKEFERLSYVLDKALRMVVEHYFDDPRIQAVYQFDAQLEAILKLAQDVPYSVGMFRPDFVYDKNGQAKICEIGCRYPINGWMFSYYMTQLLAKLDTELASNCYPVPQQIEFLPVLSDTLKAADVIFWVHHKEPGTEIKYLIDEWAAQGIKVLSVKPEELQLINNQVSAQGQVSQHFILELDREELRCFDPAVLKLMISQGTCLNDVRSLILVHDKRVLALLHDDDIMQDYLSAEDYVFLQSFLIPSYTLNCANKRAELINDSKDWILKKNSGGRGVGMLLKSECSEQTWQDTINHRHADYMAQHYVDQQQFELSAYQQIKKNEQNNKVNLVGMLLCYNGTSFGPGIFRASAESIINVHQGRGVILPCVVQRSLVQ